MKTEKLWINGMIRRNSDVNEILEEFAAQCGIRGKAAQHLRLLTEETLGMANQMLKHFDGEIWLESTASGFEIILEADVRENEEGKHAPGASPAGFMAKIAEMMNCSYMFESTEEMPEDLAEMLPDYMSYGSRKGTDMPAWAGRWSLSAYRQNLLEQRKRKRSADLNLDELEKSIVAQLAQEVTIGIHGNRLRLVITKEI